MAEQFERWEMLIGSEGLKKLNSKNVAVFGIGGVGGYVCEALARSGVGNFTLIDKDCVDITNLNRQIIATYETIGMSKTEIMEKRILSINPNALVNCLNIFYLPENKDCLDFKNFDYVVDAVDTVTAKILIIEQSKAVNVPVISAMGAGNKFDPSLLKISDIFNTSVCPLARVMRTELKKRKIKSLKVVYSTEKPIKPKKLNEITKKPIAGSNAFVPATAGLLIASEVIKDFLKE